MAFRDMFNVLSAGAYETLRRAPDNADLVEDFFGMFGRYVRHLSHIVFECPTLRPALDLGCECMFTPCRESVESIFAFVESILEQRGDATRFVIENYTEKYSQLLSVFVRSLFFVGCCCFEFSQSHASSSECEPWREEFEGDPEIFQNKYFSMSNTSSEK